MILKKIVFIFLLFASITFCKAQISFYPATITLQDNTTEQVFVRNKSKTLKNGELVVYKTAGGKKLIYKARDFMKFTSEDLEFETQILPEIDQNPVILRKITKTDPILYEHENLEGIKTFVLKIDKKYQVLRRTKNGTDLGYKEWLFKNYNKQDHDANYYKDVRYQRASLSAYLNPETDNYLLKQEKEVDFFNFFVSTGMNYYSVNLPDTRSINYNESNITNFSIGVKGVLNMGTVTNKLAFLVGANYQTSISGEGTALFGSPGNPNKVNGSFSYDLQFTSIFIGPQYNFHFSSWTVSPFVTFEPTFLAVKETNLIINRNLLAAGAVTTIDKRDNTNILNLGVNLSYKNKYQLNFSYGTYSDLQLLLTDPTGGVIRAVSLERFHLGLSYRIF